MAWAQSGSGCVAGGAAAIALWTCLSVITGNAMTQAVRDSGHTDINPRGHMLPLGSHRPSEGEIDSVEGFIHPEKFFYDYVRASKPLLFRGAAKSLSAYKIWDDSYLNGKYGDLFVEVETRKKEDRSQDVHLMTMSEFLAQYQNNDMYMVHDVPAEMDDDIGMPRPLLCGGLQKMLQSAVLWFSSGGTKSVLHNDDVDNINCLLDGTKDLIMFDKNVKDDVEAGGFDQRQGYSQVDVEAVDLLKFPNLRALPWWSAHMETGDCLYIPLKWYHQVDSPGGRNLAVNVWFQHLLWFNHSDCEAYAADLQFDFIPMSHYDIPGPGSPEHVRSELFQSFEFLESIKLEDIVREWGKSLSNLQVHELFQQLDINKDMVVTWDEVYTADVETILMNYPKLLPGFYDTDESDPAADAAFDDEEIAMYSHNEL